MNEMLIQNGFESKNAAPGMGARAARLALQGCRIAIDTRRQERVPRYRDGERENNAEHSYMLAVAAPELAFALKPDLDIGLVTQFAVVHELAENITGDVPTFLITTEGQVQKESGELAAYEHLMITLPPYMREVYAKYASQASPESRFLRYVDKLLPVALDIFGEGRRVMEEDYGVSTNDELRNAHEHLRDRLVAMFGNEFPALDEAHKILCEVFEARFDRDEPRVA